MMFYVAHTRMEGGMRAVSKVRNFPELVVDEPAMLGGTDTGMTPAEALLSSIGSCQGIMLSNYAKIMDIKLDEVEITTYGDIDFQGMLAIDDNVPPGFTEITFETHIKSKADPEKLSDLISLAQTHCPMLDTIARPVPISSKAYCNGELVNDAEAVVPKSKKPRSIK